MNTHVKRVSLCDAKPVGEHTYTFHVEFDRDKCTGCGICAIECPSRIIEMRPAEQDCRPNCVRVMLGEVSSRDEVAGLSCNIDDMTGEEIGYATERLLKEGAREAYVIPVYMKKSRPGYELRVLCDINDRDRIVEAIFRYTTTIGVRETSYHRYVMDRTVEEMYTSYGNVRIKRSSGYGSQKCKFEYDDLSVIADREEIGLREAKERIGHERISRQSPDYKKEDV